MLRESALAAPGKDFRRFPSGVMSYGEIDAASGRVAARRQGGDPAREHPEFVLAVPPFFHVYAYVNG